jgi:UDP-N-acetylmuramate dehydrogenase
VTELAELTTLGVGGPARELLTARSTDEIVRAVSGADDAGIPVLVLGGGSNVVIADAGFDGRVVHTASRGIDVLGADACGGAQVRVAAGEPWIELVDRAVAEGWRGIETLAGIPGSTGAAPVQNIGAYGRELSDTVETVEVWDRRDRRRRVLPLADCRFGYRTSVFKADPGRYTILSVVFGFRLGEHGDPVRYAELADSLDLPPGGRAPLARVRDAVLELRRAKGMVLDPDDPDTASVGSFFTNPFLDDAAVPAGAPRWPQPDGTVKTSAAWLIEHAGFGRGWPGMGRARVSTKHTLALTNRGDAQAAEILALARELRAGVRSAFGVTLDVEPVLVGCAL